MDDVYLLNSPFTFQCMEKHAAYCAMIRLGLKVPATWLLPHKQPPDNPRFPYTAGATTSPSTSRSRGGGRLPAVHEAVRRGAWVGVTRVADEAELHARYDESGRRLMHLQAAVEDFDVFARSLSIGPETMVMRFEPSRPMHDRYQVDHDFLGQARRGGRDHRAPRKRLLPLGVQLLRDAGQGQRRLPHRLRQREPGRLPDLASLLLPLGHLHARQVVRVLLRHRAAHANRPGHAGLLRHRRPRRPDVHREARGLPRAQRRLLRGRPLPRVLRRPPGRGRRGDARVRRRARLRPPARGDRPDDVPCARARAFVAHYRGLLEAWVRDTAAPVAAT